MTSRGSCNSSGLSRALIRCFFVCPVSNVMWHSLFLHRASWRRRVRDSTHNSEDSAGNLGYLPNFIVKKTSSFQRAITPGKKLYVCIKISIWRVRSNFIMYDPTKRIVAICHVWNGCRYIAGLHLHDIELRYLCIVCLVLL